ncbi:MAG TPA: cupredoxin domain-containing protein [Polyangia bacterium]|nr:cupredoxin domain-containing protein [Polyangia bacterium]
MIRARGLVCKERPECEATLASDAEATGKAAKEWNAVSHADVKPEHVRGDGCVTAGPPEGRRTTNGEVRARVLPRAGTGFSCTMDCGTVLAFPACGITLQQEEPIMNAKKTLFLASASVTAALLMATACGKDSQTPGQGRTKPEDGAVRQAQVIEISVTAEGFVPAEVEAKAGRPVKLMVTRKLENTCATEIVIKEFGINRPLPLNRVVEVGFTPTKPGEIRFACAMDMIAGVIIVE